MGRGLRLELCRGLERRGVDGRARAQVVAPTTVKPDTKTITTNLVVGFAPRGRHDLLWRSSSGSPREEDSGLTIGWFGAGGGSARWKTAPYAPQNHKPQSPFSPQIRKAFLPPQFYRAEA